MNYYKNFVVKVSRGNNGWQYGRNQWQEWCAVNCRGNYEITSRNHTEIHGDFDLESDAMMFSLRWS